MGTMTVEEAKPSGRELQISASVFVYERAPMTRSRKENAMCLVGIQFRRKPHTCPRSDWPVMSIPREAQTRPDQTGKALASDGDEVRNLQSRRRPVRPCSLGGQAARASTAWGRTTCKPASRGGLTFNGLCSDVP